MGNIVPFLRNSAFGPQEIQAMSQALDEVCTSLQVPHGDNEVRRVIAERIISLAQQGECTAARLRDRLLQDSRRSVA
ncbi:MAG: hypothetical protein K2Y71_00910 [Xanthobacteraceae bacterium]|nr:hypothetical protein [Xanthobacteraceae bacterium]